MSQAMFRFVTLGYLDQERHKVLADKNKFDSKIIELAVDFKVFLSDE